MKKFYLLIISAFIFYACNDIKKSDTSNISDSVTATNDSIVYDKNVIQKDSSTESSENALIIAGKSVGKIELGMNDSLLTIELGKPDMSDAAMGKAWSTWYGKKPDEYKNLTQLNIFTTYKDTSMRERTVQQIRTTSSFFHTENNLHVYTSLNEIQSKFPQIKKAAFYNDSNNKKIVIYDAMQQGISFEIADDAQKKCTGIIVHIPGIKVTQTYLSLHPDMQVY